MRKMKFSYNSYLTPELWGQGLVIKIKRDKNKKEIQLIIHKSQITHIWVYLNAIRKCANTYDSP